MQLKDGSRQWRWGTNSDCTGISYRPPDPLEKAFVGGKLDRPAAGIVRGDSDVDRLGHMPIGDALDAVAKRADGLS